MMGGVVCVDPNQIQALLSNYPNCSIYLACWGTISHALDESERIFLEEKQRAAIERARKDRKLAESVLQLILSESEEVQAESIAINYYNGALRYTFCLSGGRTAVGTIDQRAAQSLETLLIEFAQVGIDGGSLALFAGRRVVKKESAIGTDYLLVRADMEKDYSNKPVADYPASEEPNSLQCTDGANSDGRKSARRASKRKQARSKKPVVLIIDDNAAFAKVLERFLTRAEVSVAYASNGREALDMIERGEIEPALAICDIYMPEMNGIEFVMQIRRSEKHSSLPIIALTSAGEVEMELQMLNQGADAFVAKSEDPRILCAHVARLTRRTQKQEAA
jgi:CheY-like chemotaxis protein